MLLPPNTTPGPHAHAEQDAVAAGRRPRAGARRTTHPRSGLVAAPALALLLAACGGSAGTGDEDQGATAGGERLSVIASFYPLEYLVERVAGDHAEVSTLTSPGVDPHDLELTPRVVGSMGSADLVVYAAGMQPAVDEAVQTQASDHALDVTGAADLLALGEDADEHAEHADEEAHPEGTESGEDAHDHTEDAEDADHADHTEHAEDADHADHAEDADHTDDTGHTEDDDHAEDAHAGHDHGPEDPHFWLDPERYGHVAEEIAEQLAALDPDHAEDYRTNAAAVIEDLTALDEEFTAGLASCETRELVTTHEAFGYLANRYDLHQTGITGISPESEPSPARLAEVSAQVDELGVTAIYAEPILSDAIARTVAQETGAEVLVLDPLEGLTDASAGADYLEVMRANLDSLREGLSCP